MSIPKITRDSGIFEPPVCDRINKKTQLLQDNMSKLRVPPLEPKYEVMFSPAHIDVSSISSHIHEDAWTGASGTHYPEEDHTASCVPVINSNNSFTIGSDYSQVNFLNMTIELTQCKLDGTARDTYMSLDGQMRYIGKVRKAPICDVWFSAVNGTCLFHIPEGRNEMYILPLSETKTIDIYTFYI